MGWTIDAPLDELPDLPPLPGDLEEKFQDVVARDAKQQPSWDQGHADRVRKILESVPPIVVAPEVRRLKEQLRDVEAARGLINRRREKDGTVTVALVGYTNAGKSTLMNQLTQAGVLAEDKLFATLDPTARALKLPCGKTVMLIDTVGLIRRLPHHLVEAFKSTLEQAATADILLNVCDASSGEARDHLEVTNTLLNELGAAGHPIIPVLNKWDAVEDPELAPRLPGAVRISALHGDGIPELLQAMEDNLPEKTFPVELLLPFSKTGLAAKLREEGAVTSEEYVPEGLRVSAQVDQRLYALVKEFEIQ